MGPRESGETPTVEDKRPLYIYGKFFFVCANLSRIDLVFSPKIYMALLSDPG